MSVFKVQYTKDGKTRRSSKFYIEFKDHRGVRRRVPAYKARKESEQLERILDQLVACKHNGALPSADLVRAVESMPAKVRSRLIEWGVLDHRKEHAAKSIDAHLTDYKAVMIAEGSSEKHAQTVYARARAVFDAAGCETLADIDRDRIQIAADKLREADGVSHWTHNHRLAACKQFTKWATPDRMNLDPLAKLKGLNAKANRRHPRRALSQAECRALLDAAAGGSDWRGITGPDRAIVYRMALETGLRANEIRTLARRAFVLDGPQPTVTVEAGNAKNRKLATLPLSPSLVAALRPMLANVMPAAQPFRVPDSKRTAIMIRTDLKAAGVPYEVDGKVADFHALRHTFITNLAMAGVHPSDAKELARHSSITLTMDYYTHTKLGNLAAAVAKLPDLNTGAAAETA